MSEGKPPVANDTESLARVVLRAANRTQAKGSSVRLAVPRAPEVAHEVSVELTEAQLLAVEEYLHHHGYVERVDMGLSWGTYTITPAGFEWLEGGMPEEPPSSSAKDPVRELAQRASEEAALESALRAELEEESRRMEAFERELDEATRRAAGSFVESRAGAAGDGGAPPGYRRCSGGHGEAAPTGSDASPASARVERGAQAVRGGAALVARVFGG